MNFCCTYHQGSQLGSAFLAQGYWYLMIEWLEFGAFFCFFLLKKVARIWCLKVKNYRDRQNEIAFRESLSPKERKD